MIEIIAKSIGLDVDCYRYYDMIHPKISDNIPEESAEEIIDRMKNKLARFGGEE